ncbi:MAG: hypothetical protein F8N15_00405 [Methanobacterium sp.]|nr:hypothetical protein [Methanobacterium sp.]
MTTYRAAYYQWAADQGQTVLTTPDPSGLAAADLIEAAVAEAYNGDFANKDGDESRLNEVDLRAGLRIGEWTDR